MADFSGTFEECINYCGDNDLVISDGDTIWNPIALADELNDSTDGREELERGAYIINSGIWIGRNPAEASYALQSTVEDVV